MPLSPCTVCGGKLRRSRRTIVERFFYTGAYRCAQCGDRTKTTSLSRIKHVHYAKCPHCSSAELTALRKRDGVDKMRPGLLNLFHRLFGGRLYHCWFCRLQFYDTRPTLGTRTVLAITDGDDEPQGEPLERLRLSH